MHYEEAVQQSASWLTSGSGQGRVHKQLLERGFSDERAEQILQEALKRFHDKKDHEVGRKKRLVRIGGLVFFLSGVGTLVWSFSSARSGGAFVVPAGLIGYGAYLLATGDLTGPEKDRT